MLSVLIGVLIYTLAIRVMPPGCLRKGPSTSGCPCCPGVPPVAEYLTVTSQWRWPSERDASFPTTESGSVMNTASLLGIPKVQDRGWIAVT